MAVAAELDSVAELVAEARLVVKLRHEARGLLARFAARVPMRKAWDFAADDSAAAAAVIVSRGLAVAN